MIHASFPYLDSHPQVEILVKSSTDTWKSFLCQVDSGAFISVLTREDAIRLGIKLFEGKKISLYGIGGLLTTYLHPVTLKVAGKELSVEVAFSISDETPRLLGRKDIFDHFVICFNDKDKTVSFG